MLGQSLIPLGRWLPGGKVDSREFKALNPTRAAPDHRKSMEIKNRLSVGCVSAFAQV